MRHRPDDRRIQPPVSATAISGGVGSEALFSGTREGSTMIERERLIEIVVAVGAVLSMFATLYLVGSNYSETVDGQQDLTATGGELVVYAIAGFVLLLAVLGVVLMYTVTEAEAGNGDSSNA